MEAAVMVGGIAGTGCGRVVATRPEMVSSSSVVPSTGSNSRTSVVVATSARPSMPKATPRGGEPSAKVRLALEFRSITVKAFPLDMGAEKLP